jgi:hypothetical protein
MGENKVHLKIASADEGEMANGWIQNNLSPNELIGKRDSGWMAECPRSY